MSEATRAASAGADLRVDLAPHNPRELVLRNPIIAASGTFGYGVEYAGTIDIQRLGAIMSKGVTYARRRGAPMPRIAETPAGMLNAIGLQNPGIKGVLTKYPPIWSRWAVPVIVNIAGDSVEEFAEMAAMLEEASGIAGIELNVSCPNVAAGGMFFGCDPDLAAEVTAAVRATTTLPIIVKLTPNVTDIVTIARAVEDAGADALSLINTLLGMAIDIRRRPPPPRQRHRRPLRPGGEAGRGADGLSGRGGGRAADHRSRRHRHAGGRAGVLPGRGDGDPGRHRDLRQPRRDE